MISGRTRRGTEYSIEPTADAMLVSIPSLSVAGIRGQITADGAAVGLHARVGGAARFIRVEVEAGHVAAIRAAQAIAGRDWHACYDHGGYNYSCSARNRECGCREHRKASLPLDGVQPPTEEFATACDAHRAPAPNADPNLCRVCGTYCYGDCEAAQ